MSNNVDKKYISLAELSLLGVQEDKELSYYRSAGVSSNNVRDAEVSFLSLAGYTTGSVNDRWKAYLLSQGFSGSVDDMLPRYWDSVSALLSPSLVASRITGTAPLAVHFDSTATTSAAVTDEFREVTYTFDYGDSGSGTWSTNGQSKNSDSGGPLGAHVYETPGTYTVTLTANDGVSSANTTVTITVSNPDTVYSGTNTICIDPTGGTSGGPTGCQYVTSMPTIISNRRYLIRRGQTISGFTIPTGVTGVRIGAYGTGAKPIINGAVYLNNNSTPTTPQWVEDIVVADLDVRNGIVHFMCGRNIALLRCTLDLTGSTATSILFGDSLAYYSQSSGTGGDPGRVLARSDFYIPKYVFVVECYQRGVNTDVDQGLLHGIWGSVDCAALMGNDSYTANQHLLRFYVARKALIQHCIMADRSADGARHAIKLNGSGLNPFLNAYESAAPAGTWISTNNIIRNNTLGASDSNNAWTVVVSPQNASSAEGVQDTILESNTFINSASKQVDIQAGPARRTTTRSNTLTGGSIRIDQNNNTFPEPIQTEWRGPYYGQFTAGIVYDTNLTIVPISNTSFASSHNKSVSAPAANQILVVYLGSNTGTTINAALTDSGGGTWTFDVGGAQNFGFYRRSGGSTSGFITISWTTSGNDICWGAAFYLSNVNVSSPLDATSAFATSGFTTTPSVSITTNTANCIVLSQIDRTGGGTPTITPTAPTKLYQDAGYPDVHHLYLTDAGAAGAKTLSGTWSVGSGLERFAVAYRAA